MNSLKLILPVLFVFFSTHIKAQQEVNPNIVDEIQIDLQSVKLEQKKDTLSVDLFLISYQKDMREFKLNTYATQVIDSEGQKHLYSEMKMGRVLVQLADKQNYLHYLLEEDMPVPFSLKVANWGDKKASQIVLVFEDSTEEGKFIEVTVDL